MKKVKVVLATLASFAMIAAPFTSYAADPQIINNATTGSIAVKAIVSSTYSISLPAELDLSYDSAGGADYNYSGEYTVGVKANLLDGEMVTVIPTDYNTSTHTTTFVMNNGTTDATANVSQPVYKWTQAAAAADDEVQAVYTSYVTKTGKVTALLESQGTYNGTLGFTFAKATTP